MYALILALIGIILYIIVGGFVCKLTDNDDTGLELFVYSFWPVYLLSYLVIGIGQIGEWIAEWAQDRIFTHRHSQYFNTYFEEEEILDD